MIRRVVNLIRDISFRLGYVAFLSDDCLCVVSSWGNPYFRVSTKPFFAIKWFSENPFLLEGRHPCSGSVGVSPTKTSCGVLQYCLFVVPRLRVTLISTGGQDLNPNIERI